MIARLNCYLICNLKKKNYLSGVKYVYPDIIFVNIQSINIIRIGPKRPSAHWFWSTLGNAHHIRLDTGGWLQRGVGGGVFLRGH